MPNKTLPTTGSTNWGETLNNFLTQSLDNTNGGGINKFDTFSLRPTNLGENDKGRTYVYTQTGNFHQWTGTEWKVLNESVINVKDYGAVGDGVVDDHPAIQACINSHNKIYIPAGNYLLKNTLKVVAYKEITGESKYNTILLRTPGNKTDLGKRKPYSGDLYEDDFNVNAFFAYVYGGDTGTDWPPVVWDTIISNLTLNSTILNINNLVEYGFYAPRLGKFTIENIEMAYVRHGFYGHDCYLGKFSKVQAGANESLFSLVKDGKGISGGTTLDLSNLACGGSKDIPNSIGYNINGLNYSSFTNCSCDERQKAYSFIDCSEVTLNGCGAESITLPTPYTAALWIENSNITINSMRMVFVSGSNLTQETYYTWFNNSKVTMTGCVFSPLLATSPGFNTYNMVVAGNSRVVANNCTLPSGGLLGTSVQGSSSLLINDGFDITRITATGTKTVQFV
jgi:hypothetical protein